MVVRTRNLPLIRRPIYFRGLRRRLRPRRHQYKIYQTLKPNFPQQTSWSVFVHVRRRFNFNQVSFFYCWLMLHIIFAFTTIYSQLSIKHLVAFDELWVRDRTLSMRSLMLRSTLQACMLSCFVVVASLNKKSKL